MRPGGVRSFVLELARGPGGAYRGGERLCGRVLLEAAAPLRVRALEVAARGWAATHWLEGRSVGINAVSSDYAAAETYLRMYIFRENIHYLKNFTKIRMFNRFMLNNLI